MGQSTAATDEQVNKYYQAICKRLILMGPLNNRGIKEIHIKFKKNMNVFLIISIYTILFNWHKNTISDLIFFLLRLIGWFIVISRTLVWGSFTSLLTRSQCIILLQSTGLVMPDLLSKESITYFL